MSETHSEENCLFCKIVAGEIPATKIYEDEQVLAFDDINGQAPVHVLVIPKKHIATCDEAKEQDLDVMGRLFFGARKVAQQKNIEDYRLVMNNGAGAGQSVFHVHLHVMGGRSLSWPPG